MTDRAVGCPYCNAQPDEPCLSRYTGRIAITHKARQREATRERHPVTQEPDVQTSEVQRSDLSEARRILLHMALATAMFGGTAKTKSQRLSADQAAAHCLRRYLTLTDAQAHEMMATVRANREP